MKRPLIILAVLWIAPLLQAQTVEPEGEQYSVAFEVRRWMPGLDSQIQMSSGTNPIGTLIDVPHDLGVGDHGIFDFHMVLRASRAVRLRVGFTRLAYDGDTRIARELRVAGNLYAVNTRLVTSVRANLITGNLEWDVIRGARGYAGLFLGAQWLDGSTVLVAPELATRRADIVSIPVPVLGVATRLYFGHLDVSADLSGLTIGRTGRLYELEVAAHIHPIKQVGAGVGYRLLSVRGEYSRNMIALALGGPYAAVDVRF